MRIAAFANLLKVNRVLLILLGTVFEACGDGSDSGSANESVESKNETIENSVGTDPSEKTVKPVSIVSKSYQPPEIAAQNGLNWKFFLDFKEYSKGFGPPTISLPNCIGWLLDSEVLSVNLASEYSCAIQNGLGEVLSSASAINCYVFKCGLAPGKYMLGFKARTVSTWTTLAVIELTKAAQTDPKPEASKTENSPIVMQEEPKATTAASGLVTCLMIEGSSLVASDGTFLGKLTKNQFALDSVMNEFGTFGSKFAINSIWNEFGVYGSDYSPKSPWNAYTITPPLITKNGQSLCYMTTNSTKPRSCVSQAVIACLH